MIVLRPSFPPESCKTTRMLSSATFEPSTALANAIFCTNIGTVPPRLSTPRPPSPTRSSSRRVVFISAPNSVSAQLVLRRRHQDVQHVAHLVVHAFLVQDERLGLIVSIAIHVVDQLVSCARR